MALSLSVKGTSGESIQKGIFTNAGTLHPEPVGALHIIAGWHLDSGKLRDSVQSKTLKILTLLVL